MTRLRAQFVVFLLSSLFLSGSAWAEVALIAQQALLDKQAANAPMLIIDVRSASEFADGHVPNAINIPHTEIEHQVDLIKQAVSEGKEIILYCRSGKRSGMAEAVLQAAGVDKLLHLQGDMMAWTANNRPIRR